jgi:hypothetical protein
MKGNFNKKEREREREGGGGRERESKTFKYMSSFTIKQSVCCSY